MKKPIKKGGKSGDFITGWNRLISYLHNNIVSVNNSKVFAGLVVITLNIASRFVNLKLSKSMESYLKFTFSRDALIFCIVWMGSRDIYIAFSVMLTFIIFMDYLFNENSSLCILPEHFMDYHINLLDNTNDHKTPPTDDEIKTAKTIITRICNNVKSDDDKELCNEVEKKSKNLFSNFSYRNTVSNNMNGVSGPNDKPDNDENDNK